MTTQLKIVRAWDRAFAARGWLAQADAPLRLAILAAGHAVRVDRGERVFDSQDPPGGMYGVLSGGIGIEGSTRWHPLRLGHVLRAGEWFGYRPALTGDARVMGFIAMEPSELLLVPLSALTHLKRDRPEFLPLLTAMAIRGDELGTLVACDLLIRNARRRIAAVLLRVTGAHDGVKPVDPRGFLLDQALLGEMANASRVYSNRTLAFFRMRGWIEIDGGHICLSDIPALIDFAYGEDGA
jgi:CRP/FNR family transcriptional regulator, cyclic AMP receptor protein